MSDQFCDLSVQYLSALIQRSPLLATDSFYTSNDCNPTPKQVLERGGIF